MSSGRIEQSIEIERPVEAVFAAYRDFHNLPTFLGDGVPGEFGA